MLLLTAGLLSLAAPSYAGERVPQPVLDVDFPDPAVVATPQGLVAYATGDRVPHAWSRHADGPWRRGPGLLTHRPSWSRAARSDLAKPLFDGFVAALAARSARPVATGTFGAHMAVQLINDGPVTLWLDSRVRD